MINCVQKAALRGHEGLAARLLWSPAEVKGVTASPAPINASLPHQCHWLPVKRGPNVKRGVAICTEGG